MDALSLDVLHGILEDWQALWEEARRYSANLSPAGRAAAQAKTDDPHDALRGLLPALGSVNPDVIEFVRAILEGAVRTVGRLLDEAVTPNGQNGPVNEDPAEDAGVLGGSRAERLAELDRLAAENREMIEQGFEDYERRRAVIAGTDPDDEEADRDLLRMLTWARAVRALVEPSVKPVE